MAIINHQEHPVDLFVVQGDAMHFTQETKAYYCTVPP